MKKDLPTYHDITPWLDRLPRRVHTYEPPPFVCVSGVVGVDYRLNDINPEIMKLPVYVSHPAKLSATNIDEATTVHTTQEGRQLNAEVISRRGNGAGTGQAGLALVLD